MIIIFSWATKHPSASLWIFKWSCTQTSFLSFHLILCVWPIKGLLLLFSRLRTRPRTLYLIVVTDPEEFTDVSKDLYLSLQHTMVVDTRNSTILPRKGALLRINQVCESFYQFTPEYWVPDFLFLTCVPVSESFSESTFQLSFYSLLCWCRSWQVTQGAMPAFWRRTLSCSSTGSSSGARWVSAVKRSTGLYGDVVNISEPNLLTFSVFSSTSCVFQVLSASLWGGMIFPIGGRPISIADRYLCYFKWSVHDYLSSLCITYYCSATLKRFMFDGFLGRRHTQIYLKIFDYSTLKE